MTNDAAGGATDPGGMIELMSRQIVELETALTALAARAEAAEARLRRLAPAPAQGDQADRLGLLLRASDLLLGSTEPQPKALRAAARRLGPDDPLVAHLARVRKQLKGA